MHNDDQLVEDRIERLVHDRINPTVYRRHVPATIMAWQVPDEPVPFHVAVVQEYAPFDVGSAWGGKPWGTTWFHITGTVPEDFGTEPGTSLELLIDLGFSSRQAGFQAEGLVWSPEGKTVKGVEPLNSYVPVTARAGQAFEFYLEAAANPDVGGHFNYDETPVGSKHTAGTDPIYTLRRIDLAERDNTVWELQRDIWSLRGLLRELPDNATRRADILRALERAADAIDPDDVAATAANARNALRTVLDVPAAASAHRMIAVGHAHIDSAWLWPVRETIRKCARTFTNVLDLMDNDPDFVFAASSAQQYAWMRDYYPSLFGRIKRRVEEGRWIPVGGMWVEADTNLPGGEALARQLVIGKQFFLDEFGYETPEVWLPDSFGYTAAMPQLVRASGSKWFLTQKPSWNETNIMPHTSFLWEGIDGSQVLTHFPPADTYNSDVSAQDLARGERQHKEKGISNVSMLLYGFGDGGGGPTREMTAAAHRTHNLEGSPRVDLGSPVTAFAEIEATLPNPAVWSGEMYLEFHRGTYTSQARTKRGNRRSEHLLREAELWATTAAVRLGSPYPYEELRSAWETVLLQQFHDILPGSSIAWVYEVAEENYAKVAVSLEDLIQTSISSLAEAAVNARNPGLESLMATSPFDDLPGYPGVDEAPASIRFNAAPVPAEGAPALGAAITRSPDPISPAQCGDTWVFDTGSIVTTIDADGLIKSIVDSSSGRELVAPGERAGLLTVFRDTPNKWDAWDIDQAYRRSPTDLVTASSVTPSCDGHSLEVVRSFGSSTFTTRYSAVAGLAEVTIETEVDWHERQKMLKLAFPLDLKADMATSEIQFGHVHRPTHQNTSWDFARFETAAHRWVHVGEPEFGVAIANDSTYGHDITRWTRPDAGTTTLVRESLLRAPTFPDPTADQGRHIMRTVLRVAPTVLEGADSGYRLNLPIRSVPVTQAVLDSGIDALAPLVTVSAADVFVESVKLAEDRSGDVIIRMYEAHGRRASNVVVSFGFDTALAWRTDLLERELPLQGEGQFTGLERENSEASTVSLTLRPFEIVTLRARRARA